MHRFVFFYTFMLLTEELSKVNSDSSNCDLMYVGL